MGFFIGSSPSRYSRPLPILVALVGSFVATDASAEPELRFQVDQRGDFIVFGNTLGHDCGPGVVDPIVGDVGDCGNSTGDSAPDIYWRSESPGAGQAEADEDLDDEDARSTAVFTLPAGATVTNAYLYWASRGATADTSVTFSRPGGGFTQTVTALESFNATVGGNPAWQSVADVTDILVAQGSGTYNISDVTLADFTNQNQNVSFGAWPVVVLYASDAEPPRNLAVFDGLDAVDDNNPQTVTLDGFLVPDAGFDGKLLAITYEGDDQSTGDRLLFGATALFNAANPVNNFFNSSRTFLGVPVTTVGDLPQLTGGARSMSSFDLDVVDVTALLTPGQTSTSLTADSSEDVYYLGAFVTSISTFIPDFSNSTKTATDVNGPPLVSGDTVEFSIVVENTGNDDAINTVMTDPLPAGLTFVPGTLRVDNGPVLTEAPGDDAFDYDAGTDTLTVRVGTGADGDSGGTIVQGDSVTITFRVTIDAGVSGILQNQARITAEGALGAPVEEWPTGSQDGPGIPTDVPVDECLDDGDCPGDEVCDLAADPNVCVECLDDDDCGGLDPTCDPGTNACTCVPSGAEVCNGDDDDCNGTVDDVAGGCDDTDGDGIPDEEEEEIGTDPEDADSDDDGVPDGDEPSYDQDSDGDGLINALDPDSDDDGLLDGTELGLDCSGGDTDVGAGNCTPDADEGETVTNPLDADTDGGGVRDGSEDSNLNGAIDAGETNPTTGNGADDGDAANEDSDGDGLSDDLEETLGTDPNDGDSDDDGASDGEEHNPSLDTDGDGLNNPLDPDSDDDALFDGTEMGKDCGGAGTDVSAGHCRADADPGTRTSPLDPDTDDGGATDGSEDPNLDGAVDDGETDPTDGNGDDDGDLDDSDGDGLSDDLEETLGSDPNDADSDDDGAPDGVEANPSDDTDGDGTINILDPDSDGDGLFDGTELGLDCDGAGTDASAGTCIADGDGGDTTTSMVDPDTDDGGISDGDEDSDKDGVVDEGETDPNDGTDDQPCDEDSDCGDGDSGRVCTDEGFCTAGCRGEGGNGCPDGETCTSTDESIGECLVDGAGGGGAGGSSGSNTTSSTGSGTTTGTGSTGTTAPSGGGDGDGDGGSGDPLEGVVASGGLVCAAAPGRGGAAPWYVVAIGAAAIWRARRRTR
jgi:clumping factor A